MNRLLFVLLVSAALLPAQITDGSFELSSTGSGPNAPWTVTGGGSNSVVLPGGNCFFENLMPTEGSNWMQLSTGGQGPADVTDPSSYRANSATLSQTFTVGSNGTNLSLDVAFKTTESGTGFIDFVVVEVEFQGTFSTLLSLDSNTGSFPNTSVCGTDPISNVQNVSADLAGLFPGLGPTSTVTLWIYASNGGDTAVQSEAYIDNVTLGGGGPTGPFTIDVEAAAGWPVGYWNIITTNNANPGAEIYNFVSLTQAVPTGSGAFLGINLGPEVIDQVFYPLGTEPFHVNLPASGPYVFGPFLVPPGTGLFNLDLVSIRIGGGVIAEVSPVIAVSL